jgi:hypothetical protein
LQEDEWAVKFWNNILGAIFDVEYGRKTTSLPLSGQRHPIAELAAERRRDTAHGASRGWKSGMT